MVESSGHVVVAPDKFRGSLSAAEAAEHVVAGLGDGVPTVVLPVADGGDGTVDAVVASGFARVEVEVTGPTGEVVLAAYARHPVEPIAVIELAEASGLRRLRGAPAALTATSRGTGELVAHAVRHGARRVVLGLGGSASTDGGAGLVSALGARLLAADGSEVPPGGAALRDLDRIDMSGFLDLSGVEVVVAADVDNPLLGPHGAAAVYAPQKGAAAEDVAVLEAGLARFAAVCAHTHGLVGAVEHDGRVRPMGVAGQPGSGAAGGVGFAALAFLHAELRPGIDYFLDLVDFDSHLAGARLVITGEGALDEQTVRGKAPAGVAKAAAKAGVPVVAICGRCDLPAADLHAAGFQAAYALVDLPLDTPPAPDPSRYLTEAGPLLRRLAGRLWEEHTATR
ncbi:glycerate kinase [Sinosporangium siamense]|uniref:glycerate kinase n=1 Tax=Sinosporangium siamense TaxID=1367973 RepID=UPI001EF1B7EB|nr:glycerate kinase [Sinosporangium siamense]